MNSRKDRGWRVVVVAANGTRTYLGAVYPNHYMAEVVRRAYLLDHGEETFVVRDVPGLEVERVELPVRRS